MFRLQEIRPQPPDCCFQAFPCQTQKYWMAANFTNVKLALRTQGLIAVWQFGENSAAHRWTHFSMLQFDFSMCFMCCLCIETIEGIKHVGRNWNLTKCTCLYKLGSSVIGCQKATTWLNEEGALGSSFRILGWKLKMQTHMIHHDSYPTLHATWYPQPSFWASGFLFFNARTV